LKVNQKIIADIKLMMEGTAKAQVMNGSLIAGFVARFIAYWIADIKQLMAETRARIFLVAREYAVL
jgi:hypothetical protein